MRKIQSGPQEIVELLEKSCLQYNSMYSKEQNICVACCGSSFHKFQLDLLIQAGAERIIIAFDREWTNNEEKEKYFNKLQNLCKKYSNYCLMGFIFDHNELLNNKESPFDKGREIFEQIFKKGVRWL